MKISIEANPKEIADLVLALQGGRDEEVCPEKKAHVIRGVLLEQAQLSKKTEKQEFSYKFRVYCLARHFSVWFEDIKNDRMPDFGSPC